jgi:hypothetical protein
VAVRVTIHDPLVIAAGERIVVSVEHRQHAPGPYRSRIHLPFAAVSSPGYKVAHLDELERMPAFGEDHVWHPVRHYFGIEAFGINAYTADEPGQRVIEEHDEKGELGSGRHHELYVVLSGKAQFTLAGDLIECRAGTFVFVDDPAVRRGAIALEPGTTVLAIGGRPGEPYTVSPWEYSFRGLAKPGSEGVAIFDEGIARFPDNPSLPYNLACLHARDGNRDAAIAALRRAIQLTPTAREWAARDEDFATLRGVGGFEKLLDS